MANPDRPNGFRVVGTLSGLSINSAVRKYYSDADNLFKGDIVKKNAAASGGYGGVDRATAGTTEIAVGVVVGWEADPAALDRNYHAASTDYGVYINTDPFVILAAQGDGAGTAPGVSGVGLNFDFVVAAGDESSGASNMEVDESSGAVTADTPLKLMGFVEAPNNDPTIIRAEMLVMFNKHAYKADTGLTVGL